MDCLQVQGLISSLKAQAPILSPAWRPFLDPLDLHTGWHAMLLAVPLVLAIAIVYKGLKLPTLQQLGRESLRLTAYILALMIMAAAILWGVLWIA
jgi:hypothetical protein